MLNLESVDIALRAYIPPKIFRKPPTIASNQECPVLVLDTETTTDEYQNLRFGSCGIWISGYLHKIVIFHAKSLTEKEIETIKKYAEIHMAENRKIEVMPVDRFADAIFFLWLIENQALCVGFNLPFDLSRFALRYRYGRGKYRNWFTFDLSNNLRYPRIRIHSLDSVRSFFNLAPTDFSGKRKARFLDLRAFGFALTNRKLSLKTACEILNTRRRKMETREHGKITEEYVDYNINDMLATYELYTRMMERLKEFKLDIAPEKAFSPASLGKAYLREIGIQSFSEKNPDFPPEILGKIMTTFYGGRSEVRIRKTPTKVRLMDFKSMYPTMFTLMDLGKLLIAEKIEWYDSTDDTKRLLENVTLNSLTDRSLYPKLVTLVHIVPDDDILPVRAHYGEEKQVWNIGVNEVTSEIPLWYGLPDVIASKLLAKKVPQILRAISFRPIGIQPNLQSIEVPGGYKLGPGQDLIKSLVECRKKIQGERDELVKNTPEYDRLDVIQNQLKILANATSYGIFIEIITEDRPTRAQAYGLRTFSPKVKKTEEFGEFYNPIIATMLTSGARLMLAMAETWLKEHGGYYTFCDTDSMAVSPRHWKPLQTFFQSLNPYDSSEPLLKLEYDERNENGELLNLWFYGISAKRYVLYQILNGEISIVDDGWSSHGLGHLLHRNREEDEDTRNKWEKELWTGIIEVALGKSSEQELCERYIGEYAVSRYTVTKPSLHRRLKAINRGRQIAKQIKPFNFILVGSPQEMSDTGEPIHPITKFTNHVDEAPFQPFTDYNTGIRYPGGNQLYWKTLPEIIREYVNHPESKFINGTEQGRMKRRHLLIREENVKYLGKEANEIEETEILGVTDESYVEYA